MAAACTASTRRLVHVHVLVTTSQRPPATQRPRPNRRALVSSQSLPEPSLALALLEAINPILRNRNGLSPHRPRNPLAVSSCLVCPLLTYAHALPYKYQGLIIPPTALCKLYTSKIHIVSSRLLRSSAINQFLRAPLQWTPSLRLLALAALDRASSQQQQLQDPPFRHAPVAVAHRWIHGRYLAPRPGHSITSPNTSVQVSRCLYSSRSCTGTHLEVALASQLHHHRLISTARARARAKASTKETEASSTLSSPSSPPQSRSKAQLSPPWVFATRHAAEVSQSQIRCPVFIRLFSSPLLRVFSLTPVSRASPRWPLRTCSRR